MDIIEEEHLPFAVLIRQNLYISLETRLSRRPKLTLEEKRFLISQLLIGVLNIHENGLFHNDLNSTHIFLTSQNHLLITDFGSYKPLYLLDSNSGDYRYFFQVDTEDHITLAPEKFVKESQEDLARYAVRMSGNRREIFFTKMDEMDERLIERMQLMDVFSCGCIMAEIMLDGSKLFEKEAYPLLRRGKFPLEETLSKVEDEGIRILIKNMLQIEDRKPMKVHLEEWNRVMGSEDDIG